MNKTQRHALGQKILEARLKKTTRLALQKERTAKRQTKVIDFFFKNTVERDDSDDEDPGA